MSNAQRAGVDRPLLSSERTYLGVDVGEKRLAAVAPAGSDPEDAFIHDGDYVREAFDQLAARQRQLRDAPFGTEAAQRELFALSWILLRQYLKNAANHVVEHAKSFERPVLVLEELRGSPTPLWEWRRERENLGTWLVPTFVEVLREHADEHGIEAFTVDATRSTRLCHRCEHYGELEDDPQAADVLECTNESCPVDVVCRDRSAALTIAQRGQEVDDVV